MENLRDTMFEMLRKCKMLEDFVTLHLKRDSLEPQLKDLKNTANKVESAVCKVLKLHENRENLFEKYNSLIKRSKNQQLTMLNLMLEIRKIKLEQVGSRKNFKMTGGKELFPVTPQFQLKCAVTPSSEKMYLQDYENSPFVSSKFRPKSLQFCDFDVKITDIMFNSIPKYMRGRENLNDLINFLEDVIISCFNDKYKLIFVQREYIKNSNDLQIWKMYKAQIQLFPNQKFITQGDITRKLNKLIDNKLKAKISMLRHLGIIKEQHKSQTICYIWIAN